MTADNLCDDPAAQRARKLAIATVVEFATAEGTLATREGPVAYAEGRRAAHGHPKASAGPYRVSASMLPTSPSPRCGRASRADTESVRRSLGRS